MNQRHRGCTPHRESQQPVKYCCLERKRQMRWHIQVSNGEKCDSTVAFDIHQALNRRLGSILGWTKPLLIIHGLVVVANVVRDRASTQRQRKHQVIDVDRWRFGKPQRERTSQLVFSRVHRQQTEGNHCSVRLYDRLHAIPFSSRTRIPGVP